MTGTAELLQAHPAVETVTLENEAVLFDERDGRTYHLNPAAAAVWLSLLDEPIGVDELAAELADLFVQPREAMRFDVAGVVEDFAAEGLLVSPGRPDPEAPDAASIKPASAAVSVTVLPRPPDP
jgi:hypothetical protein